MKELDFLFIYEHKVRELENLCLIKYELDKRGYRTQIIFINDAKNALSPKPIYHTKVLCMMACYHNRTLRWHVKDFVKFDKIIDLQWENIVYPKDEKREGAYKNYTEIGRDVVRVSWGRQNERRLLETVHMDPRKVKVVGHVGMDFLRKPLSNYYLSREELFGKYRIPIDKKVILFASPYYGDTLSREYIEDMCMRFGANWVDYYQFMCDSQRIVLQWMEQICHENNEIYFIFRPHPGHPSTMAQQVEKECANFQIIGSESIKQWIVACDKIYTGNSSVVVEAFFAKKMCQLVFPIPVTEGFELKMIADSKKLTSYHEFYESIYAEKEEFPTSKESIEEVYIIDWDEPNYMKFARMAEEVIESDYYKLSTKQLHSYQDYNIATRFIKMLLRINFLYQPYLAILKNEKLKWRFLENQRVKRQQVYITEQNDAHELTNSKEINEIIDKIGNALK